MLIKKDSGDEFFNSGSSFTRADSALSASKWVATNKDIEGAELILDTGIKEQKIIKDSWNDANVFMGTKFTQHFKDTERENCKLQLNAYL